ncbi:CHAT domain-containing protein [Kitasatospora sp. NPDC001539]|uniref:CHAT domain-containing protein n=1 Tax=Kitasatospora sp. NPDC001539 TaxID=3154384 RepID=UPI00332B8A0F
MRTWREFEVVCRRCSVRSKARSRLVMHFPGDARAVLDLLTGRLNVHRCPVCGAVSRPATPLVVVREDDREFASWSVPQDIMDTLEQLITPPGGRPPRFVRCERLEDLVNTVRSWADDLLRRGMSELSAGERVPYASERVPLLQTPLALLLIDHEVGAGLAAPAESAQEAAERLALAAELLTRSVVEAVDRCFTYAYHHGGPDAVAQVMTARIPLRCLRRPEVLAALADRCPPPDAGNLLDPATADRAVRWEYLNALAHALAGVPNPRSEIWTSLCFLYFRLSRVPGLLDPGDLLDATTLRRTITFASAWDVAFQEWRDPDVRRHLADWFDHIGMAERFVQEMSGGWPVWFFDQIPDDTELVAALLGMVFPEQRTGLKDSESGAHVRGAEPGHVEATCRSLLTAGRQQAAELFAWTVCNRLEAEGAMETLGWAVIRAISAFAWVREYGTARRLLIRFRPRVLRGNPSPGLRCALENERGNILRYSGRLDEALAAYESAEAEAGRAPGGPSPHGLQTLRTNRAIVLRDTGRVDLAIDLLTDALAEEDPDSVMRVKYSVSLALCHLAVNRHQEALQVVRKAAGIALSRNHTGERVQILVQYCELSAVVEDQPDLAGLQEAWDLTENLPHRRALVAGAVLFCACRAAVDADLVSKAQSHLDTSAQNGRIDPFGLLRLVQYRRARGDLAGARAAAERYEPFVGRVGMPWELLWERFRLLDATGPEVRWPAALLLLDALDDRIVAPAAGTDLVGSWLADKEEVQRELVTCATEAVARHTAGPAALLRVAEFVGGREVRSRLPRPDRTPSGMADRVAAVLELSLNHGVPAALVTFLEAPDGLRLVTADPAGVVRAVTLPVLPGELRSLRAAFDVSAGTGCVTTRQQRAALAPLAEFLRLVGESIADHLAGEQHLLLLPSAELLGIPLHAATLPGGRLLLERNSIGYGPNLGVIESVLATGPLPRPGVHPSAVLAVPKEGDREEFAERLRNSAHRLAGLLGPSTRPLDGVRADKAALLEVLPAVRHLLVLAHGANSLPARGRGICVADGKVLPPAPLPVEQAPELRRFLVDSADLAGATACPEVVVSIACSSGRNRPGAGGTRIGLERALFAGGTRSLIAPLWDVDHASALGFVESLYTRWSREPGQPLAQHYRAAVLENRDRYEHPFHWAPFALRGSWL